MEYFFFGSDWFDVEEIFIVRFFQEEFVFLKFLVVLEFFFFIIDYVMYFFYLYSSFWCDYVSYWISSFKFFSYFFIGSSSNDVVQVGKSSWSCMSDYFFNFIGSV